MAEPARPRTLRDARRALRNEAGQPMRQKDVADAAGFAISTVSMAENGYAPKKVREPLAQAVGASAGSFSW